MLKLFEFGCGSRLAAIRLMAITYVLPLFDVRTDKLMFSKSRIRLTISMKHFIVYSLPLWLITDHHNYIGMDRPGFLVNQHRYIQTEGETYTHSCCDKIAFNTGDNSRETPLSSNMTTCIQS